MTRARLLIAAALVALMATACTPAASWLRDQLDTGGPASLTYTEGGVTFDPGGIPAYQVHVTLRAAATIETTDPTQPCIVTDARYLDCDLGTVDMPVTIKASGQGIIASAVYTRTPAGLAWEWAYTPIGGAP